MKRLEKKLKSTLKGHMEKGHFVYFKENKGQ